MREVTEVMEMVVQGGVSMGVDENALEKVRLMNDKEI